MTELRITKGTDLELYADGEQLFGVTGFRAKSQIKRHEIREYLSGEAFDSLSAGESHEIELSVLSLFGGGELFGESFELSVVDGGTVYVYQDCAVVSFERDAESDKNVCDRYVLTAKRLMKRSNENA